MEFYAAPVVDGVMADILQSGVLCHSYDHRHVLNVESTDKQQSSFADT